MPVISDASFSKAVHVIAVHGDTDISPYPFDDFVMYDVPDKVVAALKETEVSLSHASGGAKYDQYFEQHPVNHYSTLSPVSQTGFRWATQLDPFWNAYLLAAVIEIAPDIEAARLPRDQKQVFAYRYNNESTNQLYLESAWRQFQEETRKRSESDSCKYVVTADISDFYPRIYHHRLENSLKTAAPEKPDVIRTIMSILFRIAQNQSYGLPVGSDASRLLAECALDKVDHLLATNDDTQQFCRYVDDYRFFVESEEQAYRAIAYLSEKLQLNEGLSLQKSKTRIMSVKEYQTMLEPPRPVSGSAADFMSMHIHYDPYSSTADADYEEIKKKLSDFNIADLLNKELDKSQIHVSLTKKLIGILKLLDSEEQARIIETLLDNIDQLIPVVPQVMKAVKQATSNMDKDVSASVQSRIRNLIIENRPIAQIDLNRAYMIRVLGTQHSQENEQLLIKLYSEDSPVIIKRDIMLIMANWGASYWVSDRKNYLGQEDKWVQRAFFLASYALGDEGRHWRQHKETSGYDKVISEWAALKRSKLGAKWVIPL